MTFSQQSYNLAPEIYVYKKFLTNKELNLISSIIENLKENDWILTENKWANRKVSKKISELNFINNKLNMFIGKKYNMLSKLNINRIPAGESMYVHQDRSDDGDITYDDAANINSKIEYGLVIYLNSNYNGGEIYYPEQLVEFKPEAGDLIIHSGYKEYRHGVREITSGTRYTYTNFLFASPERIELSLPD